MSAERPDDARTTCANCAAPLAGPFCHQCGQKDLGTRVTVLELVREVISESFEIEGRLPRTLVSLAIRPGEYLGAYLDGKRRSYASPFRFYLVMVFVAALALGWRGPVYAKHTNAIELTPAEGTLEMTFDVGDPEPSPVSPVDVDFPDMEEPDRVGACPPVLPCYPASPIEPTTSVWLPSLLPGPTCHPDPMQAVMAHINGLEARDAFLLLYAGFVTRLPLLMALVMGGVVATLKVLWPRQPLSSAVVTGMILQVVGLIAWVLALLGGPWALLVILPWWATHVVVGLRRAYATSWVRAVLASGVLASVSLVWFLACVIFVIYLVLGDLAVTFDLLE